MKRPRRLIRFSDHPDDPHPTVLPSEWSAEELAERYVAATRARMMAARAKAEGQGSGDQAATPARPADDETDNQAPQRRKPGAR